MESFIDESADGSDKVQQILRQTMNVKSWHNERFGVVLLNSQNGIIGLNIISEGTINESAVYVREVALLALLHNAYSVILFHNHPGGSLTFSGADINVTKIIKEGLKLLNIGVLDHILLVENDSISMAERGDI